MLTAMSEQNGKIVAAIQNSEELAIFKTPLVRDVIDYKWERYA